MPDDAQHLREEAITSMNVTENHGDSPAEGFVMNRIEAIVREVDLELDDPRIVELAWRAYLRGVIDRDITVADLIGPLAKRPFGQ